MRVLVTGADGFIGSRLSGRLLTEGCSVTGVDSFTDYYPRWIKERNIAPLLKRRAFALVDADLNDLPLALMLGKIDAVFHLAAQAGVRASWGRSFSGYVRHNIQATQALLEAAKDRRIRRIVFASSSSVYGSTPDLPMTETSPLKPLSPYGVTKLAAEALCVLYAENYGVPAVSLRFFTVYGPGQRPDMAFHKFFVAVRNGRPVTVYGNGRQTRDFTFVDDIIDANLAALERGRTGEVYNVGGGHREPLNRVLPAIGRICGRPLKVERVEKQKGDVRDTFAGIAKARRELGFAPRTDLEDGLRREWEYIQELYADAPPMPPGRGKQK
jgi:nucleoside-diphosphate-sugar epimerase